ncbi:preprotein translocase subunit SecA [candidate division KSB1 bacterium]|nr:preprotein translocase subunit SecA [candidate division KSB1 bacterium]
MFSSFVKLFFGTKHDRDIKKIQPLIHEINKYYHLFRELTDDELRAKTEAFKTKIGAATIEVRTRIQEIKYLLSSEFEDAEDDQATREDIRSELEELQAEDNRLVEEALDSLLPEAFAVVKETCRRFMGTEWNVCDQKILWEMIPFDVQLIGAVVLHQGKIAEMATGEGKTLVATMPLYLNALPGKGVHLVTVNDYLAQRDSEWMGKIYEFLGLTVSFLKNEMEPTQRHPVYATDITYGTNNEFGFDYLRDNMTIRLEDRVQRGHNYAIIDEVDSVLVDEARTPLIISGPVEHSTQQFSEMKPLVKSLVARQVQLINTIVAEAEELLKNNDEYGAGVKLLQAQRGAPKNKRLMKLLQEVGVKKLIQRVENDYLRDKRLHEIDDELFFSIDEKTHVIDLTEKGRNAISPDNAEMFVLPDLSSRIHEIDSNSQLSAAEQILQQEKIHQEYGVISEKIQNISQLLRAYSLFERDVEYVVEGGKVLIVDEFTGRLMPGRRYSDGLHQALEAKENVQIERETQTLATITLQNYFRLYHKLAGMTGTAETEATELWQIYKLDVVVIPTNESIRRIDYEDQIYRTKREKFNAIITKIEELNQAHRPVLVGTVTVDTSELLSRMLKRKGIRHSVLNAKYHQQEAEIIIRAGQPDAVTIATNMAGRGTDIKLGQGVVQCDGKCYLVDTEKRDVPPDLDLSRCQSDMPCGLQIIGTERHEARRIDRQLRGRSGRQGDPGASRFYLSLEDDLMRLFGSDRIASVMDRIGVQDGEVIQHSMITRSIERAQKRVEMRNFEIRKHLLEYDDVMNQQREVIYDRRKHALEGENLRDEIQEMIHEFVATLIDRYTDPSEYSENWDWENLLTSIQRTLLIPSPVKETERVISQEELRERLIQAGKDAHARKEKALGKVLMRRLERYAMLRVIDERWRDHLYEMDQMKEGINLRAYGQKDPLIEYKSEGFRLFSEMLDQINEEVLNQIFRATVETEPRAVPRRQPRNLQAIHQSATGMGLQSVPEPEGDSAKPRAAAPGQPPKVKTVRVEEKVGRNDPCPCGSGKKYKKCHGQ